jgi:hypothetical protein
MRASVPNCTLRGPLLRVGYLGEALSGEARALRARRTAGGGGDFLQFAAGAIYFLSLTSYFCRRTLRRRVCGPRAAPSAGLRNGGRNVLRSQRRRWDKEWRLIVSVLDREFSFGQNAGSGTRETVQFGTLSRFFRYATVQNLSIWCGMKISRAGRRSAANYQCGFCGWCSG